MNGHILFLAGDLNAEGQKLKYCFVYFVRVSKTFPQFVHVHQTTHCYVIIQNLTEFSIKIL